MAISIQCDSCGSAFKVADSFAGKRGKCPKCGHVFRAEGAAAGSAVSKKGSSGQPAGNNPASVRAASGTSKAAKSPRGSSPNVRPAKRSRKAPVQPPQAPVRAVPVGSLPEDIPTGRLPGESGMGTAQVRPAASNLAQGVRPASGPMISPGKATATSAYRHKRKKGTPVILWVIIVLGGLSAGGGWIYVATREDPAEAQVAKKQQKPEPTKATDDSSSADATDKSAKGKANEAERDKQSEDPTAPSDDQGKATGPEKETGDDDLAVALGGGDLPSTPRRTIPKPNPMPTGSEKEPEKETPAVETAPEAEPVSAEQLKQLAAACEANAWKADSAEQYAQLSALAGGMMNYADEAARDAAMGLLNGPLSEIVWTTEKARRMNRQAMKDLDTIGKGAFVLAEVTEQVEGGAILKLVATEAMIKIEMSGPQLALIRPGKNFLLIGTVQPESYDLPPVSAADKPRKARVIDALFRVGISEIYDREGSSIGPAGSF